MSKVSHHCSVCGEQVDEFCADHPSATVESIVSSYGSAASPTSVQARLAELESETDEVQS